MGHADDDQDPTGAVEPERAERLASTLAAIADPMRLQLLTTLREGPRTPTDLAAVVGADETKVVEQLERLVAFGLIERGDGGVAAAFSLHDDHVAALLDETVGHDEHRRHGLDDRAARER